MMQTATVQQIGTALIALSGIAAATVAVCLGKIDAASFTAIVSAVLGVGLGAGVHASGTTAGVTASDSKSQAP